MEQFNRALTFIFILIFAFGVAFFIFYRLGLFQKIFPQVKMSLPAFFSGTSPTPTLTPTTTPSGEVIVGQENIPTPDKSQALVLQPSYFPSLDHFLASDFTFVKNPKRAQDQSESFYFFPLQTYTSSLFFGTVFA